MNVRPFLTGATILLIIALVRQRWLFSTVPAASVAGKFKKSEATTRRPMHFRRYATQPLPTKGSAADSKSRLIKCSWIQGKRRRFDPIYRNSGYRSARGGNGIPLEAIFRVCTDRPASVDRVSAIESSV